MIGNDIVDLALARKESNWKRNRFLDKIFTKEEQLLITQHENPEVMVWNLWSRKEAAYKIYNRQTGIRGYFPIQLVCYYQNSNFGTVSMNGNTYYTQTTITKDTIHTIAVTRKKHLDQIEKVNPKMTIHKVNGIPFLLENQDSIIRPVSISHHGRFIERIML